MKRFITLVAALFVALSLKAQVSEPAANDSIYAPLDSLVERYFVTMMPGSVDEKCAEMNFIISVCTDSKMRQHVAQKVFGHYLDSPMMGEEEVALRIYDEWFASGLVAFSDPELEFRGSLISNFSRRSQLYMDAPHMVLRRHWLGKRTVPDMGELSILYFFDTSCKKCQALSALLPYALEAFYDTHEDASGVKLVMIYTGSDKKAWREFRKTFSVSSKKVQILHLWDPEIESNYQRKYDVVQTPRLFFIDKTGMILGRRLEVDSLVEVMEYYYTFESEAQEE